MRSRRTIPGGCECCRALRGRRQRSGRDQGGTHYAPGSLRPPRLCVTRGPPDGGVATSPFAPRRRDGATDNQRRRSWRQRLSAPCYRMATTWSALHALTRTLRPTATSRHLSFNQPIMRAGPQPGPLRWWRRASLTATCAAKPAGKAPTWPSTSKLPIATPPRRSSRIVLLRPVPTPHARPSAASSLPHAARDATTSITTSQDALAGIHPYRMRPSATQPEVRCLSPTPPLQRAATWLSRIPPAPATREARALRKLRVGWTATQNATLPQPLLPPPSGMPLEPWCVEVSTVSTVSRVCRGSVEGVSVDTNVEVSGVSGECQR